MHQVLHVISYNGAVNLPLKNHEVVLNKEGLHK